MPKILDDQHFDEGNINPLMKYFRVPGLQVKLPTGGAFMPPGSIRLTIDGKVPVYPMRGADEMLLKSPDALMNGYAIEKLLQSCVPAIKLPRLISSPDLDVVLMAIRAATNGETVTLSLTCPNCDKPHESEQSLGALFDTMTMVDPENAVRLSDEVVVYVRPHNLENATKLGIASFEEARKVQALEEAADQSERAAQVSRSMVRLANLNNEMTADCIVRVVVPEGTVTDKAAIGEFVNNISKTWSDKIAALLETINQKGIAKYFSMKCTECEHEWRADIEFNPATFFDASSPAS